jgi:hypothetical protein
MRTVYRLYQQAGSGWVPTGWVYSSLTEATLWRYYWAAVLPACPPLEVRLEASD